jgi:hypothetical protein
MSGIYAELIQSCVGLRRRRALASRRRSRRGGSGRHGRARRSRAAHAARAAAAADATADAGRGRGGRSPPTCGRDSGRREGGATGGRSPPHTGRAGKRRSVRREGKGTSQGHGGRCVVLGACQFDHRNTLRWLGRARHVWQCYRCEIQVITFVNLMVTNVNGLEEGITNVNGTT